MTFIKVYVQERDAAYIFKVDYPSMTLIINADRGDGGYIEVNTSYRKLLGLKENLERALRDFKTQQEMEENCVPNKHCDRNKVSESNV